MRETVLHGKVGLVRTTCRGRGGPALLAHVAKVGLRKYAHAMQRPGGLTRGEVYDLVMDHDEELHIACILADDVGLHPYEWGALFDTEFDRANDAGELWNPFLDVLSASVGEGAVSDLHRRGMSYDQIAKVARRLERLGEWVATRRSHFIVEDLGAFRSILVRRVILSKARQLTQASVATLIGDNASIVINLASNPWLSQDIAAWAAAFVRLHMNEAARNFTGVLKLLEACLGRVPCTTSGIGLIAQGLDAAFANAPQPMAPSARKWMDEIETGIIAIVQRPNLLPPPTRADVTPWLSLTRDSLRTVGIELVRRIPRTTA